MNFMQETRANDCQSALEKAAAKCARLERELEDARKEYEYHRRLLPANGGQPTIC